MQLKASLFLKKNRAADTEGYIKVKVPVPGAKPVEKSLKYKIPEIAWDAKKELVRYDIKGVNAAVINADIIQKKADILKALSMKQLGNKAITKTSVKAHLNVTTFNSKTVVEFIEWHIADLNKLIKTKTGEKPRSSPGYTKMITTLKNKVEAYAGSDLTFEDIDNSWMEGFENELIKEKLNYETTIPNIIRRMQGILKIAAIKGLYSPSQSADYKRPVYQDPERIYLTIEETDKIYKYIMKASTKEEHRVIGLFFLIECYAGIRFSDWGSFSVERLVKDDHLYVRRTQKTKEPIYIPLSKSKRLKKVIAAIAELKYQFSFSEPYTNRTLKEIGDLADVKKSLTTHVGRHTCATLFLDLGYSLEAVSAILGVSLKTVQIYAKTTRRKIKNEYDKLGGL